MSAKANLSTADFYAGRRVLVAGGLGFIGSNLAIALAEAGAVVTIVDAMRPEYGARLSNIEPVRERVRLNLSDLRDAVSLEHLVAEQEVIFNLAGQASHIRGMNDPRADLRANCESQLSLLECCRRVNPDAKLVLASTRQVYGRIRQLPVDETHPTVPVDVNGVHKLAAEMYYEIYRRVHGLRTVVLRLTNTYGPRMDLENLDKGFAGVFLRRALAGEPLRLYGGGTQKRDLNYASDVVAALLAAGAYPATDGETYNLGHPRCYTLLEFAAILRELTGCKYETVEFPAAERAIDIGDYWGNFAKFQQATGWAPAVDLRDGLQKTVDFLRAHAGRCLP